MATAHNGSRLIDWWLIHSRENNETITFSFSWMAMVIKHIKNTQNIEQIEIRDSVADIAIYMNFVQRLNKYPLVNHAVD